MGIENSIFFKHKFIFKNLLEYGFIKSDVGYHYSTPILESRMRVDVYVSFAGVLAGRVVDCETGDEFPQLNVHAEVGGHIFTVQSAYARVLEDIEKKCTITLPFFFDQTNRLAEYLKEKHNDLPEYPFSKVPNCAVYRHKISKKVYCWIMEIQYNKLIANVKNRMVEIVNIKIDPEKRDIFLQKPGVFPGYHTAFKNWLTIALESTIPDPELFSWIEQSRDLTRTPKDLGPQVWLVPGNPKYYNFEDSFTEGALVFWKQSASLRNGDTVLIYVSNPVSEIRYKCLVMKCDIPYTYKDANVSMTKIMQLLVTDIIKEGAFTFERLRTYGVHAIRGPRHIPQNLYEDILKSIGK